MNSDIIINIIKQEYTCPICKEIPYIPVKVKVINNINNINNSQFESINYFNNWDVCNDVFCKSCILKILYHNYNNSEKRMIDLKCPVCNQYLLILDDMLSYLDCIIEDKKIKKITDEFNFLSDEFKCRFECNFKTRNFNEIIDHMYNNKCDNQIIECKIKQCNKILTLKNEPTHGNTCVYSHIQCPFCTDSFNSKEYILVHLREYHNISTADLSISINNLF